MSAGTDRFSVFVATLGRGPGKSRSLTRDEAHEAMAMLLAGQADPHQVGAFLMLLRYRGEDPEEIAGLVEGVRSYAGFGRALGVGLDWPSYGAGRTRGAPWFLLAALALARSGVRVLMHGTNEFSAGQSVEDALTELGRAPAAGLDEAERQLAGENFAYVPLRSLCAPLAELLALRSLLGLRSPMNTAARLLDPGNAAAGLDGVFHPPYLEVHMGVAERLGRPRLAVVKGGGGEAERAATKPVTVRIWDRAAGRSELILPALGSAEADASLGAVWAGAEARGAAVARATIALALVALGRATAETADAAALEVWDARHAAAGRPARAA